MKKKLFSLFSAGMVIPILTGCVPSTTPEGVKCNIEGKEVTIAQNKIQTLTGRVQILVKDSPQTGTTQKVYYFATETGARYKLESCGDRGILETLSPNRQVTLEGVVEGGVFYLLNLK
ncbi:MAG: hypothetical protein C6I01_05360 [Epsilonproteobacteria bacterium]|nr:hypothetical protein [Campylobacterota bacterium]NPA88813.1 hypothetical protein [Campylobacterota bacterium]